MTDSERTLFHKNYLYMWKKLNTSHYQIKCDTKSVRAPDELREAGKLLPSYAICSQCYKEEYVPSEATVRKIVLFYNKTLRPPVDVWQFLNEDLSRDGASCCQISARLDRRFVGIYWGYYVTSADSRSVVGAVLRIYERDGHLIAAMVTGLRSAEEMRGPDLAAVFQDALVQKKDFDTYYSTRQSDNDKRCYYYEGTVEISRQSALLLLRSREGLERKLMMTLDISNFVSSGQERPYAGGLAFILSTSDGPFDARFYQMGLVNQAFNYFDIHDERIAKYLRFRTGGRDVRLSSKQDRDWYDLAIRNGKRRL